MAKRGKVENLQPYPKGKSGNPNGRPRTLVGETIKQLKSEGIEGVAPSQVGHVFMLLMNCNIEDLKKLANDEKQSFLVRIVAKEMLSKKGQVMLDKMLDRAIGRPQQQMALTASVEANVQQMSDEELLKTIAALTKELKATNKKPLDK